ncbi:MAG TPA: trimeric intracellular cation channel family protein [Candidatus Acidoferrales bacterium]|nr:trimeric intracellular cation channel family protein [Candidatus Acidoferrales bacterium]
MSPESNKLLLSVDLAGTFLFAVEGALIAVPANLDLLGVMVLAFTTALVGGIIRDVLIGASPPASLRDWRYASTAFAGGAIVFFLHPYVRAIPGAVILTLDAAALALFAVAGTEKALLYKMHPFIAVLLGAVTAVGGGTVRDVLLAQIPNVLRSDIYATAALAGALVMVVATRLKVRPAFAAISGGLVCFLLRLVSVWQHWSLPKAFSG